MGHETTTMMPVVLVGTQRSGTTWFGKLFSAHPHLAYWEEPRHVWTWGNSYLPDDRMTESHARPRVVRHIRRTFERYVRRCDRQRLCEKTPSNCLRLPFIRAVYPDAKIILILRDGRSVIRSTAEVMGRGVPLNMIARRALRTPPWEWPAYLPRAAQTLSGKLRHKPIDFWGPRPPGWRDWVGRYTRNVVLAKQWSATISVAVDDASAMGSSGLHVIRYEDMMKRPRDTMQDVVDFLELPDAQSLVDEVVSTVDPTRQRKWREQLDEITLEEIRPHMEPTLNKLGYAW